jgi:hypothetical protein
MTSDILNDLCTRWDQLAQQLKRDPARSALFAFGAGFLFSVIPVRKLFTLLFRLGRFAVKPALLIFGALKIYEYFAKTKTGSLRE